MVEDKELNRLCHRAHQKCVPGLRSRPVSPLPEGIKVDLSRVIGALIEHVESVFRYCMSLLLESWMPPPFHFTIMSFS